MSANRNSKHAEFDLSPEKISMLIRWIDERIAPMLSHDRDTLQHVIPDYLRFIQQAYNAGDHARFANLGIANVLGMIIQDIFGFYTHDQGMALLQEFSQHIAKTLDIQ